MPSFLSAPSYQDFALQLAQGNWVHSSRWNTDEFCYFTAAKQQHDCQLLLAPKLYQHKRKASASLAANWVLQRSEGSGSIGWAELQAFPCRSYRRGMLFFAMAPEAAEDSLALLAGLVSLAFTIGRFDHITLLALARDCTVVTQLSELTGTMHTLYSFSEKPWLPNRCQLLPQSCLVVDRSSWRSNAALQSSQRQLKHIEMRLQRMSKFAQKPKKRKRNFLARLFKPTIEDSLF